MRPVRSSPSESGPSRGGPHATGRFGARRAIGGAMVAAMVAVGGLTPHDAMAQHRLTPVQDAAGDQPAAPALDTPNDERHATARQPLPAARLIVTLRIGSDDPVADARAAAQDDRSLIRVPAAPAMRNFVPMPRPLTPLPVAPPIRWDTRKGPSCIAMRSIAGVRAATRDSIDILTRERERLRLELERGCRALDFYSGFYMARSDDAALCRERDLIQARSGERCTVKHIRRLVAVPVRD